MPETQASGQSARISLDGNQVLTRIQTNSAQGGQVHAKEDGDKSSSRSNVHIHKNLEGGNSIKTTPRTSSTGGKLVNPKTDACRSDKPEGCDKRGRKSKVTYAQLLEKYQKLSEAKSTCRPAKKASESPPARRKSKDRDWQKEKSSQKTPPPPFGPPMPKSQKLPYAGVYPHSSWGRHDPRACH